VCKKLFRLRTVLGFLIVGYGLLDWVRLNGYGFCMTGFFRIWIKNVSKDWMDTGYGLFLDFHQGLDLHLIGYEPSDCFPTFQRTANMK
jgi:hypothetical protein